MNFYDFRDITNHAVTLIFLDTDKVKDMKKNLINHMATILSALSSLNDDLKKSLQYYCTHMSAEFLEELLAKTKEISVVANFATTAADGKVYNVDYYNLDIIISIGYRVKSQRSVQFRIWATNVLKAYMIKGFAMDDERLKGNAGGNN